MIRQLAESDLPQILAISALWQSPWFSWSEQQLQNEFKLSQVYGLFEKETLVAFAFVCDRSTAWEISCLATRKNWEKRGYMKSLLKFLIDQLNPQKELWLEVHENNIAARYLYEKLGFSEVHRRPGYYQDQGAAVLYTKKY